MLNEPKLVRHPTSGVGGYRALIAHRGVPGGYQLAEHPSAADCNSDSVRREDRAVCLAAN